MFKRVHRFLHLPNTYLPEGDKEEEVYIKSNHEKHKRLQKADKKQRIILLRVNSLQKTGGVQFLCVRGQNFSLHRSTLVSSPYHSLLL